MEKLISNEYYERKIFEVPVKEYEAFKVKIKEQGFELAVEGQYFIEKVDTYLVYCEMRLKKDSAVIHIDMGEGCGQQYAGTYMRLEPEVPNLELAIRRISYLQWALVTGGIVPDYAKGRIEEIMKQFSKEDRDKIKLRVETELKGEGTI